MITAVDTPLRLPAPRQTPYGRLRAAPFQGDAELPAQTEVVIIGGGICGVLTAWSLARRGIPVLLCEKAEIACESSSRAFGWVSELLTALMKTTLARASKGIWRELQAQAEVGYREYGLSYLAESAEELDFYRGWIESVAGMGDAGTCILSADDVAARYPGAARRFAGAIHAPSDGSIEPVITTVAVAELARRAGAKIVTGCAVRGLDVQAGRVAGVFTERGHVRASTVLCAANAWSRIFCGNHGVDVPQLYAVFSMGCTDAVPEGPPAGGGQEGWAWRRQIDGGYSLGRVAGLTAPITRDVLALYRRFRPLMDAKLAPPAKPTLGRDAWIDLRLPRRWNPRERSPFEQHRVLCGSTDTRVAAESLQLNTAVFPAMAGARITDTWAGTLVLTPDNSPIAGPVDQIPGFHLLTGCGFGFTWGPALGEMMADLMTGRTPTLDPQPFRLSRFYDGSPLEVTP